MFRTCVLFPLCLVALSSALTAQDAILGVRSRGAEEISEEYVGTKNDLIVRQWMEKAFRNPTARAESIRSLARLNRWREVNQLLASIDTSKVPASTQSIMAGKIGPTIFLRIMQNDNVSDKAKSNLDALAKAAREVATHQATLEEAIKKIVKEGLVIDEKLSAARTLVRGGNASIIAITHSLTTEHTEASREQLLRVLLSFGEDALKPLELVSFDGNPDQRLGALRSLRLVNRKRFLPIWVTALHARDSTSEERGVAMDALRRFESNSVSFDSGVAYLAHDLQRRREAAELVGRKTVVRESEDRSLREQMTWAMRKDQKEFQLVPLTDFERSYRLVYESSARLKRLGTLSFANATEVFTAEVGYRLAMDPDWLLDLLPGSLVPLDQKRLDKKLKPLDEWKEVMESAVEIRSLMKTPNSGRLDEWIANALVHASEKGDEAAMLGIIRLLQEWTRVDGTDDRLLLMHQSLLSPGALSAPSTNPGLPMVVELAASSPCTRIRFEAAILVSRVARGDRYAGQTRVRRTLAEMSRLSGLPILVLVETRTGIRVDVEKLAIEMGMQLECVPSVAELLRLVNRGGDIRVIVSKSNLRDQRPIELLDSVRRLPRGERLPIVFFPADQIDLKLPLESRWAAPLVQLDGPVTGTVIQESIENSRRTPAILPLTGLERRSFRAIAIQKLGRN